MSDGLSFQERAYETVKQERDLLKAQLEQAQCELDAINRSMYQKARDERDQAQAACTEMRELIKYAEFALRWDARRDLHQRLFNALSTTCGLGWFNAEQLRSIEKHI